MFYPSEITKSTYRLDLETAWTEYRNPRYLNEDNFKSEDNPRFLNYLIFKVKTNKIKKFQQRQNKRRPIFLRLQNAKNSL